MTASQQRIQNLLDKITSNLENGYFHKLLKYHHAEKQKVEQEKREQALAVRHEKDIDFVPGVSSTEVDDKYHPGMPVYASLRNVDSASQLTSLFRVPEDYGNIAPYSEGTLSQCYTNFGKRAKIHVDALLEYIQDDCLVQLTTGEIKLIAPSSARGNSEIAAILAFPQNLRSFCIYTAYIRPVDNLKYDGEVQAMGLVGMFSNCPNLQYIAAIPEGVHDLQLAFQNCPKLNCPIHIPSTVTRLYGMLNDCGSFSSSITIHTKEREIPGLQSLPGEIEWKTKIQIS